MASRILKRAASSVSEAAAAASSSPLQIKNPAIRKAVLTGEWNIGPPSLRTLKAKRGYYPPNGLKEVFPLANQIVQKESALLYEKSQKLEDLLIEKPERKDRVKVIAQIDQLKSKAELHNPEVIYNHTIKKVDYTVPIFRHLAERDWKSYDLLILMQRLETLKVIPDTMATLEPRAAVQLQFPGVVNKWLEPGKVVPTDVASRRPALKVQEFDHIASGALYTVLIVDPDTPDPANDSYSTTLHWAVTNVPLSNVDFAFDPSKGQELVSYLPPHPEKNTPAHRYSVWVYRQAPESDTIRRIEVKKAHTKRKNFDIRAFAETYGLTAVGAHVYRCTFDRTTDAVRQKFGLGPGTVYSRHRRETHRDDPRA